MYIRYGRRSELNRLVVLFWNSLFRGWDLTQFKFDTVPITTCTGGCHFYFRSQLWNHGNQRSIRLTIGWKLLMFCQFNVDCYMLYFKLFWKLFLILIYLDFKNSIFFSFCPLQKEKSELIYYRYFLWKIRQKIIFKLRIRRKYIKDNE